jgi:uncharacterized protein YjiS (DUF1127 family)
MIPQEALRYAHVWPNDAAQQFWRRRTYLEGNTVAARQDATSRHGARQTVEATTMTARIASNEPEGRTATPDLAVIRTAAAARDAAIGRMARNACATLIGGLGWLFGMLLAWQERATAYQRLRYMSDRELADVGLTREQIARAFDPSWTGPSQPAARPAPVSALAPAPANDAAPAAARAA